MIIFGRKRLEVRRLARKGVPRALKGFHRGKYPERKLSAIKKSQG